MKSNTLRRTLAALPLLALALTGPAALAQADAAPAATEATAVPSSVTGWNVPVYDVPADAAVRYGMLENGMKYAILPNTTPQDEVVLRMRFDVGFTDELDGQLNAAHFLEHMAFNGSTNVPEGEMVALLERLGLKFGADTNASTDLQDTIYKLTLPRGDAEQLGTGLMLMREIGSELTITQGAVDRERGILLSETQTRNTYQLRNAIDQLAFLAAGTRFAERFPGPPQAATTATLTAEQLRPMYERYYRPDNATLVIVGNVDADAVEAMVRERFADWQKPQEPIFQTDVGSIDFTRGPEADTFVDPATDYTVTLTRIAPYVDRPATIAEFDRAVRIQLASMIINRRLQRIARNAESPVLRAGFGISDFFDVATNAGTTIVAKGDRWAEALAVGEQEMRRALDHGFTQAEMTEALTNLETALRNGAERQATRPSTALADALVATARSGKPFVTPAAQLAVFEQIRAGLNADAVHATFREAYAGSGPLVHVAAKQEIEGGEAAILAALEASQEVAVAPPVEEAAVEFAYTDFGTPGTVVADETVEDLGFRSLRFDNNVMLNLKKTDFKDKEILFHVRVGTGQLAYGEETPGASLMMNALFSLAALEAHDYEELQRILAGQNVGPGFNVADDHFHVSGSTKAADLLRQMQVSAAFLTAPGYREEAEARWKAIIPPYLAQQDVNPQAVLNSRVPRILANGDKRFGVLDEAELLALTFDDLRAAVTPSLSSGPIEIAVVGDIDEAAVIDAVAKTFGALPARPTDLPDTSAARQVSFAQDRSRRTLYHTGAADQGLVEVVWPTDDNDDLKQSVVARLAAEALDIRLTEVLREELGATYSPQGFSTMSDTYDGFGYLGAIAIVEPAKQAQVFDAIAKIAGEMRDAPISEDLLTRARNPMVESRVKLKRENNYWIGALESAQLQADRLDRTRRYDAVLAAVTPADIQAFARQYLTGDEALEIAILPQPAAE